MQAGYQNKYGYLTLVQYWLARREASNSAPDLWKTSEQPITAVKDAITIFLDHITLVKADDRVGLAVYTYSDSGALLAAPLTHDLASIEGASRRRQAGHYVSYTNIGAGLCTAREELAANARADARKVIVLLTDGLANRPTTDPVGLVRAEAQHCAANGYPVITISLGVDADTNLMQEVAEITGGVHFNIPGGTSVADYEQELKEVFRRIAANRELNLVK